MESAKGGLRGDQGTPNGQDAGTRDKVSPSPSSLQTLSAEMRKDTLMDRRSMAGIAKAETQFQCTRPFARYFIQGLGPHQRAVVQAMVFSAVTGAVEAWEVGRAAREAAAFYD